jgi:acetyl-CoA C-acetyltransferase
MRNVGIVGFGQTPFVSSRPDVTYPELVAEAARLTLADARTDLGAIQAVVFSLAPDALVGIGNAERCCVEVLGAVGKPFMRVNTGGSTGLTSVQVGYAHVASGMFDVVLVVGADRVSEAGDAQSVLNKMWDVAYERPYPQNTINMLALSAVRYMHVHGATERDMARVTVRNRSHAARNPWAHLRTPITEDEVLASRMLSWPIKLGDACPSSTGGAGVVLASEDVARRLGRSPAWIRGIGQNAETFWMGDRVGPRAAADHGDADGLRVAFERAYDRAGIQDPTRDVHVAELYAPFSPVEYHAIEAALFCEKGESFRRYRDGEFTYGGRLPVVNPSGGTLCTNPIAVTGLVRAGEAALQVTGRADDRQVEGASVAVASAIGGDHQFYATMVLSSHLERIAA